MRDPQFAGHRVHRNVTVVNHLTIGSKADLAGCIMILVIYAARHSEELMSTYGLHPGRRRI